MTIYFVMIAAVLIIPLACAKIRKEETRNKTILLLSVAVVFFVMACKASSVGRDIYSYELLYERIKTCSWKDYDISWMEWGYEFLTMVFTHIFHASFQTFMVCVYLFVFVSYYFFIRRYSRDYTSSVIIYICFTFFTFDTSAVRTMIGVTICLFAVPFAEKKGILNTIIFVAITLVAAQIHQSAYIFFAVYFVIKHKFSIKTAVFYFIVPILLFLFRSQLYTQINLHLKTVEESDVAIGGNVLIYIFSIAFTAVIWFLHGRDKGSEKLILQTSDCMSVGDTVKDRAKSTFFNDSGLAMRVIYAGLIVQIFCVGTVLTRMAEYMIIFILILVPNSLARLNDRSRIIAKWLLYILAIIYFWRFSLVGNDLDIVPYRFFWNV